ncbi:ATP-binding protein [Nodosilinea sp. P-1105]|uniref:ATP-binding protein n=1 Tax=Nodosilinea sp. P-1105 TaxID=2546229 RepID=UPI00146ABEDD|nr:ATP-binding protein [Nodosilinea sp. P-1105]NMF84630.1 ATP-binding protein [Nodosilinea sp. P-1105]
MFQKATKTQARLRFALCGPSGSGKTYSALEIARHLGKSTAVIDTEHGSASKYADLFDFDVCELTDFHPSKYMEALRAAGQASYDVIVIDSLSHAWFWELNETSKAMNSFTAWGKVRPLERALIDAMLAAPAHVIVTMRTKTEWVLVDSPKSGKPMPERVGTAPIQASGIEYEFDIAGELDLNHLLTISKSRCPDLSSTTHLNPGQELAKRMLAWLSDGVPAPETALEKGQRIRAAREAVDMSADEVRLIMEAEFSRSSPAQLSSEDCDRLIAMIEAMNSAQSA